MTRKSFIQFLSLGSIGAVIAPLIGKANPMPDKTKFAAVSPRMYPLNKTVDEGLMEEMEAVDRESRAVYVVCDIFRRETGLLQANSVTRGAGPLVVNLNLKKNASDPVKGDDKFVSYAMDHRPNGAIRLVTAVSENAKIVRQRTIVRFDSEGVLSTKVTNEIRLCMDENKHVIGELGRNGIHSMPGKNPTYAIDYENAVVLFTDEPDEFAISYHMAPPPEYFERHGGWMPDTLYWSKTT